MKVYIDFQYTFFHRDLVWAMFSNVHHPECVKLGRKGSWSKKAGGWYGRIPIVPCEGGARRFLFSHSCTLAGPMPKQP